MKDCKLLIDLSPAFAEGGPPNRPKSAKIDGIIEGDLEDLIILLGSFIVSQPTTLPIFIGAIEHAFGTLKRIENGEEPPPKVQA